MKTTILLLLTFGFFSKNLEAQTYLSEKINSIQFPYATQIFSEYKDQTRNTLDTLSYLQSIVNNKSQYIGHNFSSLLNDLQINIKYFQPIRPITYDKRKETSTSFGFNFPQTPEDIYLTYPSLEIYWQTYLDADQSDILWESNRGGWSSTVASFYSNSIIVDIKLQD